MGCLMPWSAWWVQGKVVVSTLSSSEEKKQNCQEVKKNPLLLANFGAFQWNKSLGKV